MTIGRTLGKALAVGTGAAAAGYAGYTGLAWLLYGKQTRPSPLECYIETPEVAERHAIRVAALPERVWAAAMSLAMAESPLVRLIFQTRAFVMTALPAEDRPPTRLVDEVTEIGWGVLEETAGREIVFGAVCRPWEADAGFRALPAKEFAGFNEPGFARVVWNMKVESVGESSRFVTETLVATTDADSRRRFRRYWALACPGIRLIRHEMLRLVRAHAEQGSIGTVPATAPL